MAPTRSPELSTHTTPLAGAATLREAPVLGDRVVLMAFDERAPRFVVLTAGVPVVLGRKAPSQLALGNSTLSREHARFTLRDDRRSVLVEDLGSTNGTWRGPERVRSVTLAPGESVRLGAVVVQIEALAGPDPAPFEPPAGDGAFVLGAAMRGLYERLPLLSSSTIAVLLQGETGTGKEVLARALHEGGPRRARPMVRVNCGAIPSQLVESTLFGHERGAFTGALQQRQGVFEAADGGTLLLDELGELPLPAQAALLRVLETRTLTRVGSSKEIPVDVRVVAATHRDLEAMSLEGTFRTDLYYRLATVVLRIPPLRERSDEIEPLALRFLAEASGANGRALRGLGADALAALEAYAWPGNIRELRNAIEHAAVFARGALVAPEDLPERVREAGCSGKVLPSAAPAEAPLGNKLPGDGATVRAQVEGFEAALLTEALEAHAWSRQKTAEKLGIPVRTLSYRMKVLGVARGRRKPT